MAITCTVTPGTTMATGIDLSASNLNELGNPTVVVPNISQTSITLENFAVANLPTNGTVGRLVFVTNGDGGSLPCIAVDNGTNWVRVNLGSAVSATDVESYIIAE